MGMIGAYLHVAHAVILFYLINYETSICMLPT